MDLKKQNINTVEALNILLVIEKIVQDLFVFADTHFGGGLHNRVEKYLTTIFVV